MQGVLIRGVMYLLAALFLGELIRWELEYAMTWRPFTEYGYIQWIQSASLFTCTALAFGKSRYSASYKQLALCMALFMLILFIRENDEPLELFLPHGSWKYVALLPAVYLITYGWKNRHALAAQLVSYAQTFSFGMMVSGFVVLVFSRLFGRNIFWEALMGENFMLPVKLAAEEGVELLAIGLILMAVVEFVFIRDSKQ